MLKSSSSKEEDIPKGTRHKRECSTASDVLGIGVGAGTGAILGSVIPGVGTAIGALLGFGAKSALKSDCEKGNRIDLPPNGFVIPNNPNFG